MKKKILLPILIILTISSKIGYAQFMTRVWSNNSQGELWQLSTDFTLLDDEIYVCGNYDGKSSFNFTHYEGGHGIFITKLNSDGDPQWTQTFSTPDYSHISKITTLSGKSILVCGYYKGNLKLDKYELKSEKKSVFLAMLDKKGQVMWCQNLEGDFINDNLYVSASDSGKIALSSTVSSKLVSDRSIQKYKTSNFNITIFDSTGSYKNSWAVSCNKDFKVKKLNYYGDKLYVAGEFSNELDIKNQRFASNGMKDCFLLSLDSKLELNYIKTFGSKYNDEVVDILNSREGIIIAGNYTDQFELDKHSFQLSRGGYDGYVFKLNNQGEILWSNQFGSKYNEYCQSLCKRSDGSFYINVNSYGNINKVYRNHDSEKNQSEFILKYTSDGKYVDIDSLQCSYSNFGQKLAVDSKDYVYYLGNYQYNQDSVLSKFNLLLTKLKDCNKRETPIFKQEVKICGEEYTIRAVSGYKDYFWNGTKGQDSLQVHKSGQYELIVRDSIGCTLKDTAFIKLNSVPSFGIGDTLVLNDNESVLVQGPENMSVYVWNGIESNFSSYLVTSKDIGILNLKVIDINGCENSASVNILKNVLIKEQASANFTVFPIPSSIKLFIEVNGLSERSLVILTLINEAGIPVIKKDIWLDLTDKQELDISTIPNGHYTLCLKSYHIDICKQVIVLH